MENTEKTQPARELDPRAQEAMRIIIDGLIERRREVIEAKRRAS